jgi:hypothetical protein
MPVDHSAQAEEFKQKLPGNIRVMVRREFKKLPSLLEEEEMLHHVVQGRYQGKQGLVVATDRRVLFIEEGMMRSNLEDFPYERISSVQTSTGMMFGKLTIYASGNKAEIDQIAPKEMGLALGDFVRKQMKAPSEGSGPDAAGAVESALDKLRKLGELKEAGVLSEDEFNAQKAKLLESI